MKYSFASLLFIAFIFVKVSAQAPVTPAAGTPNTSRSTNKLLEVGSLAPEWELSDSNGKRRKLSEYRGKIVVMDFWATWCAPCVKAQPTLQSIHEKYSGDVIVLGMNAFDKENIDLNAYKTRKNLSYDMILDSENIAEIYKIKILPIVYLLDRDGKILYTGTGYSENEAAVLLSEIEKARNKQ